MCCEASTLERYEHPSQTISVENKASKLISVRSFLKIFWITKVITNIIRKDKTIA